MRALRLIVAGVLAAFLLAWPASAREFITRFDSAVTVNTDASLTVRERITVQAEGFEIKRGILRDFPTVYTTPRGMRVRVGFDVLSVTRDGERENFTVESISNGKRVRIGKADVRLLPGIHAYEITYRTTRQLGFFDTFDELYWNVTGNGWSFAIDRASVTVALPQGAAISQSSVYTGAQGETGQDARIVQSTGNRFRAEATREFAPGEGLTIAVAWQKGIVTAPTEADKAQDWFTDNLGIFGIVATMLASLAYYLFAWFRVGRDPPAGTVVPLFHPPEGLGPAGVRYVWKQGFDDKAFAAAVVGLAVKGRANIVDIDGTFRIEKRSDQGPPLTRSEVALYGALPGDGLVLKQPHHARVRHARDSLSGTLDDEYDGTMFINNFGWFALGLALSVIGLAASGFMMPEDEGPLILFTSIFSTVWWAVILGVGWSAVKSLFGAGRLMTRIRALMGVAFLIPFVGAGIAIPTVITYAKGVSPTLFWFVGGAAVLAGFNLLFYWLLKAPTPSGRRILDKIEGFRMYMMTAEEERLKVLHPPEKTPELFERYMPYAMALNCENEWNDKFAAVLAAAAVGGATGVAVGQWYHGGDGFGSQDFSDALSSNMTSAISSSSVAPGSSSGSGGGGFSGGGGGGGGGSGW